MTDLILLHGGEHGSWCWDRALDRLTAQPGGFARILTLDMPGCGRKRGRDTSGLSIAEVARELNEDVRAAGFEGGVLVGHSVAGIVMPLLPIQEPELYSQLVYLAASLPEEGQTIVEMMGTALHDEDPETVGWPVDPATSTPQELNRAMFCQDLDEATAAWLLGEVALDSTPASVMTGPATRRGYDGLVPATYILTQRDRILPPTWQRRFAERAGCDRVLEIDTPHEPFVSRPDLLAEVLRQLA
ncbi:alpha/beta fold hydrolase [Gordonia humi]|uniref:Pimeloyl-ACP methyl ester carboxylesterase n=1 Tax=Gordonia humi TaxID=686429 RepID=A0A840EUE8_9ACTN|nr:alpha/beta hydrolase [Gordonia humi]MBB4135201.1 pimeloyl-ACP methyl ester carboxylesterase [Gordonia humi]